VSRPIGFSTGSLARGDFHSALAALEKSTATAVELSALRENELAALIRWLPDFDRSRYAHVSFHAPSALADMSESALVQSLKPVDSEIPIVVHADLIKDFSLWRSFGRQLLIENMDKRKPTGRAAWELRPIMEALPEARLCFDFAHARQIDPTLCEAMTILHEFDKRIGQLHISELSTASRHEPLSYGAILAIRLTDTFFPRRVPVILEFDAQPHELNGHLELARSLFPGAVQTPRTIAR
jgi:hypothetical protein